MDGVPVWMVWGLEWCLWVWKQKKGRALRLSLSSITLRELSAPAGDKEFSSLRDKDRIFIRNIQIFIGFLLIWKATGFPDSREGVIVGG